ncbi:hypothetical protein AB0A05_27215 [Streptomyces sp. NPDC046374]|uniref:hypothetical protein n=1 Tax=Streptomyces sp. NPDC046374 TaxID=3154917 RepID=UPI0033F9D3E5
MSAMEPGPEGVKPGDVFLDPAGRRWLFERYQDDWGDVLAFNRDGEPVTARELIAGHGYRYQRPRLPMTAVEFKTLGQLGGQIGTADSWPRKEGGPADSWAVYDLRGALRRVWLVHTGLYWPDSGRVEYGPQHYDTNQDRLVPVHVEHANALARLTLWYEGHQVLMGQKEADR